MRLNRLSGGLIFSEDTRYRASLWLKPVSD
jgi:hypothetical protein